MLPHEVVRQNNGAAVQPGARPHSRQVAPTTRATGRFISYATSNSNRRQAFEDEKTMISKAQVLRDVTQPSPSGALPSVIKGMMALSQSYAAQSTQHASQTLSPTRPHSTGGGDPSYSLTTGRTRSPPRHLGKAVINASNVLPDEISAKASVKMLPPSTPTASTARPQRVHTAGTNGSNQTVLEISLERTSPIHPMRISTVNRSSVTTTGEDEVVLPGSTLHRSSPDRSGFLPIADPSLASATGGRPLTPAALTMPVSPSKGLRALQHVAQSRTNDSHQALLAVTSPSSIPPMLDSEAMVTKVDRISTKKDPDESIEVSMARLLASYGITAQDVVSDSVMADVGCSVQALAQMEGVEVNLKSMALNAHVPSNTFSSLIAPRMGCNELVWIPCTAGTGSQTRSVAVKPPTTGSIASSGGGTTSPTKAAASILTPATQSAVQNHLIIDLSEWPMIDHGPTISIPAAFHYRAGVEDHNIDRCLTYHVTSSNSTLFACGTPLVTNSDKGTLSLVPNPGACGSSTLTVYLEDCASIDPETGCAMRSPDHVLYIHTLRTENTATNPASNGDGTPHPPLSSTLPVESAKKVIVPAPGAYMATPINSLTRAGEDPATGGLTFYPDPTAAGAAPTDLHAPYSFPLPNLFEVREDSCLRDQVQGLLERTKAAAEAFENSNAANISAAADDLNPSGRLDCAFPFSNVLAPCYSSIATPFEYLSGLCGPSSWVAQPSDEMRTNPIFEDIARSIDESALTDRLEGIKKASSISEAASEELCALLARVAVLRQVDGGVEGQRGSVAVLEELTQRRAESIGFASMADIGTKEPILQDGAVKPLAEEQVSVQRKCEQLMDALLMAAKTFCFYGRFVEALEAAEVACRGSERYIGKDSHVHLSALVSVGTCCALRGDFVAASKSFETAVDISDMVHGSTSAATAIIVCLLATSYCQHGDIATGISCLQRAQRIYATLLGRAEAVASQSIQSASPVTASQTALVTDLRLRASMVAAYISVWRLAAGELHRDADSAGAVQELVSAIGLAEDSIYQEQQLQEDGGLIPTSTSSLAIDESLSASRRSAVLALINTQLGHLLLSRRDATAIERFEEAARLVAQAAVTAEDEETQGPQSPPSSASTVAELKLMAVVASGSIVAARMASNDMFNEGNIPLIEGSLATLGALVGERHIIYCRHVAILGQLTRFTDDTIALNVHVGFLRTRETVRSVMCEPSLDAAVIASVCALTSLQQAKSNPAAISTSFDSSNDVAISSLQLAVGFALEAIEVIGGCDALFGNTIATESMLESVVEPMCIAVFSAVHEPLPQLVIGRLERRIASLRAVHGETSLRLMEPLLNLGTAFYLEGNYQNAHHYLSKALKVADTINLIFLLGHLFKPAVHLTATQVQERNRVAGDRLQVHQSVQFSIILFAIAGVYVAQGNADDAQSTYLQAQAALELAHMQTSLATSLILTGLSKFLHSEGHYGDSLAHIEKADGILREFHLSVGHESHNAFSVVPTAGKVILATVEEVRAIIGERTRSKGYSLCKQVDGRHRFVVYL